MQLLVSCQIADHNGNPVNAAVSKPFDEVAIANISHAPYRRLHCCWYLYHYGHAANE